jgi:hypothetical protein
VVIVDLPLGVTVRGSNSKPAAAVASASSSACVVAEIWSRERTPVDCMRAAVLTVSPKRQYCGLVVPTTPDRTGPELTPSRTTICRRFAGAVKQLATSRSSSAIITASYA